MNEKCMYFPTHPVHQPAWCQRSQLPVVAELRSTVWPSWPFRRVASKTRRVSHGHHANPVCTCAIFVSPDDTEKRTNRERGEREIDRREAEWRNKSQNISGSWQWRTRESGESQPENDLSVRWLSCAKEEAEDRGEEEKPKICILPNQSASLIFYSLTAQKNNLYSQHFSWDASSVFILLSDVWKWEEHIKHLSLSRGQVFFLQTLLLVSNWPLGKESSTTTTTTVSSLATCNTSPAVTSRAWGRRLAEFIYTTWPLTLKYKVRATAGDLLPSEGPQ